jgi:WD40 repeat protein
VAFSHDGKRLATSSEDTTIKLWSVATMQEVVTLPTGQGGAVWCLAFSPDGNTLASGRSDGTVRLWRAASFAETDAPESTRLSSSLTDR